jgi:type IV pilus assembly protein PilO
MAKFSDLNKSVQVGIVAAVAVVAGIVMYFTLLKPIDDQNGRDLQILKSKQTEVAQLAPYEHKLTDLERQIETLKQQLEIQKRIVPDEKEVPGFIRVMQGEAAKAGVEIRRYTSQPAIQRDYFSEVPFEMDIDGPFYGVVSFFDRISKLERIINVSGVQMANVKKPSSAKVKKTYPYAPNESVVVNYTATTFYSSVNAAPPAPPKAKK